MRSNPTRFSPVAPVRLGTDIRPGGLFLGKAMTNTILRQVMKSNTTWIVAALAAIQMYVDERWRGWATAFIGFVAVVVKCGEIILAAWGHNGQPKKKPSPKTTKYRSK